MEYAEIAEYEGVDLDWFIELHHFLASRLNNSFFPLHGNVSALQETVSGSEYYETRLEKLLDGSERLERREKEVVEAARKYGVSEKWLARVIRFLETKLGRGLDEDDEELVLAVRERFSNSLIKKGRYEML